MTYSKKRLNQLAKPRGEAGAAILDQLNRVNVNINGLALDVLGGTAGAEVLEIGFGGGALIADGLNRFPHSKFHGAEISDLAIERGHKTFHNEIRANKVSLFYFDGHVLPFTKGTIDTVIAVNVIYFVSDVSSFLNELRRVLKPDGRCVVGYAEESPDRVTLFERATVERALACAGFTHSITNSDKDNENGVYHCTVGYMRE